MIIRRVSVGPNFKEAMNYLVGQEVMKGTGVVDTIRRLDDGDVQVWVLKGKEIYLWKTISSAMPITIEYDLNF
jgi:hypothetical protein